MNPLVAGRLATTARCPHQPAVHHGDHTATWAELDAEVRGLHGALCPHGPLLGTRVGLLSDRSAAAIIGIHATLLAGAAVVPLDPGHPPARLAQVIHDAQLSAILVDPRAQRRHARTLTDAPTPVVSLTQRAEAVPPTPAASTHPALILYTSGSTGRPKGVVLSAQAVAAFVTWASDTLDLGPRDSIAHLSPLSFDLSTLELFGPALTGAATRVVSPGATMFPASLATALAPCSVVYTVPSVWRRLLAADLTALATGPLRHIVYAGEPFAPDALTALMQALPGRPVHNFFGPTETNVCCAHRLTTPPGGPVPIGHAASGARLSIAPEGSAPHTGELLVSGPSVMSGYWNRPEHTARSFVHDDHGRQWLRTGDRVRRDASGVFFALGRRDTMLKHRGFRLQPEEVEQALESHPTVEVARVSVHPEAGLYAEVVLQEPSPARDLLRHVSRLLPPYMVPTTLTPVAGLSRTPRGKLDRTAPAIPLRTDPKGR